eukprot:GDKH01029151.1.p4 GENE.GDKH01029151.1~~GDKH01029151.1.p4  ORF type:complete len:53 (+),score=5.88 GDKH01029151.1:227-385(+)
MRNIGMGALVDVFVEMPRRPGSPNADAEECWTTLHLGANCREPVVPSGDFVH